jgi:hypothetical protein
MYTARLQLHINMCIQYGEPIDWYFIRSQVDSLQEADKVCCELITQLNLAVDKNGEEYTPNCLEV